MPLHRAALAVCLTLLLWSLQPVVCLAQQCGCNACRSCQPAHCCKHHRHLAAPPQAPVLGSAPAMMAPIIFTPVGPTAMPAAYPPPQSSPDKEALRDLLRSMLQSPAAAPAPCSCNNGGGGSAAPPSAAPLSPPQPAPDNVIEQKLDQISAAVSGINSRLTSLEARVMALEKK